MKNLIVTEAFEGRQVGHQISDPKLIEAILAGEHARKVVPITVPDQKSAAAAASVKD